MARRGLVLLALVAVGLMALGALTAKPLPGEVQAKSEAFFKLLQEGNVSQAYASLAGEGRISQKKDALNALETQTELGLEVYGEFEGVETLREMWASPSLVQGVYLYKMRDFALVWWITYYRSSQGWQVANVTFNDQLHTCFQ